jgi:glutathione S-transferase
MAPSCPQKPPTVSRSAALGLGRPHMLELVHLVYSPWSEFARWALDHHGLRYRSRPYVPMVGAPALRLRLRRFSGKVTVPVLFTPHGTLTESTAIARFADRIGKGAPLFPEGRDAEIDTLIARAERAMQAGRNLVTRRTGRSAEAQIEALPPPLRKTGPVGALLAREGVRYFVRKYDLDGRSEEADLKEVADALEAVRAALGGKPTMLGAFSYADIVASGLLQIVEPVDGPHLPLGPVTRGMWRTEELARRFADLVEWRDALYAAHRIERVRAS